MPLNKEIYDKEVISSKILKINYHELFSIIKFEQIL